ncbi:unnamed protein product [Ectocarpus sp. CCAP 1310/34]|nr:unnamed protein product [Ectocarpus sp. CCAP 1310/34]
MHFPCPLIPSFTARALCCAWFHVWICLFPLVPLSKLRATRSNSRFTNQVPALRAGVVSASRPRQAGMVIGVVPRYDPHGMGMPLLSRPGGGSGSGGGGDVPATGRQRAATASSLEQPREESILPAAALDAGRVISRRNSSPDPTSPSPPLGSNSSGSARGNGVAPGTATEAPAAASPPVALEPPRADVRATSPVARRTAAGWPVPSGWVGGRSGGGDGRSVVSARHTRRHNVSAPLLGSFPFSLWRVLQTSTVDGQAAAAAAGEAVATTTGVGHARTAATDLVQRRHGGSSSETSGDSDSAEATGSGGGDGAGVRRETGRGVEGEGQGIVPVFSPPSGSRGVEEEEKKEAGEMQRAEDTPVPAYAGSAVPPAAQADAPVPAALCPDGRQAVAYPAGSALLGRGGPAETTKPLRDPIAVAGAATEIAAAPARGQSSLPRASGCPDGAAGGGEGGGGGGGGRGASPYTVGPVAASTAGVRSNKINDVTVATKGNEDAPDGHHRKRVDGGEAAEGGGWAVVGGGGAGGGRAHAGAGGSRAVVSGRGMTSPAQASPGPADGTGQVFRGGGQRQQQQQQQQQWEEERLLQGQESPRRQEESGDVLRLGLGGTQRWPDNEPGDSGGRASPPMASLEER